MRLLRMPITRLHDANCVHARSEPIAYQQIRTAPLLKNEQGPKNNFDYGWSRCSC
jgi:hypothetical protein